jgi:hypothetical protein
VYLLIRFIPASHTPGVPVLTRANPQNGQPYHPKGRLGKMLGGKVPGQSYAQMSKSKAANASAAKYTAPQRQRGGFDSENFRGLCRGILPNTYQALAYPSVRVVWLRLTLLGQTGASTGTQNLIV